MTIVSVLYGAADDTSDDELRARGPHGSWVVGSRRVLQRKIGSMSTPIDIRMTLLRFSQLLLGMGL